MAIGLSHGGSNMYSSKSRSESVMIGTKDGLVIIEPNGGDSKWTLAYHVLKGRFISSIIVEPESGMIFAGSFFGSIHASSDGGKTWEKRDNGLTQHDVYSLACTRHIGKTRIYAGTEPAHLFYSEDLGEHWKELTAMRSVPMVSKWTFPVPPFNAHAKFIFFDPRDANTVYVCIEQGAFLKSTDAGESWCELNTLGFYKDKDRQVEHFYDVHKAVIDPRDPQKILVSGGAGLYVTNDGGKSWERWTSTDWAPDVYPDGLVLNPRLPDIMFVSAGQHNPQTWHDSHFSGSRIYRSANAGRNWEVMASGLPDRLHHEVGALCLEDWGSGFAVYAATTGGEVFCSEDGGDHWSLIFSGLSPVTKKGHERLLQTG